MTDANQLYGIASAIEQFVGIDPRGSGKRLKVVRQGLRKKKVLARMMFYKLGIDRGIKYYKLVSFTGDKNHCNVYRLRKRFIKLLSSSAEEREKYNRFIIYMNELRTSN